jgi:hypothetical protein
MQLYSEGTPNTSDESIWLEDAAVIEIEAPDRDNARGFIIEQGHFRYVGNYKLYYPEVDEALIAADANDYTKLFLESGDIQTLVEHFRLHPDSRRQLATTWSPKYLDPNVVGVCITQIYCRLRNGTLELHSHVRANDAYRLLLLDMQLAISVQREIAHQLTVPMGRYIHYVDSLHFYKHYATEIKNQRKYMQDSVVWRGL